MAVESSRQRFLLQLLISFLMLRTLRASSLAVISDGFIDNQQHDPSIFESPTDLSSAGCHRAVDKNGTIRFLVLDAGSTGTRAVLHKFRIDRLPGSTIKLRHLGLQKYSRRPGLSAFQHFPDRSRDQLKSLLTEAAADVPAGLRDATCVALRATAGLRLLDARSRHRILLAVKSELAANTEFLAPDIGAATVLSGEEEAKFAWLSVNYMLGRAAVTVPVLEMGGGSTQVAYESPVGELFAYLPAVSLSSPASPDEPTRRVRVRSYLGLGIRESVLRFVGYRQHKDNKSPDQQNSNGSYENSCIASNLTLKFNFGPVAIHLTSSRSNNIMRNSNSNSYVTECFKQASNLLDELQVKYEPGLTSNAQPLYSISGVYYLVKYLKKHGSIGTSVAYNDSICPGEPQGTCKAYSISVGDIAKNAAEICQNPPQSGPFEPYYCINLALLTNLLRRFQIPDGATVIGLGGSDNIGWTLGFSMDTLIQSAAVSLASASIIAQASVVGLMLLLVITILLMFEC